MLKASAPGKLLILGEYAVLEGAPALVQAVDRRAEASVESRSSSDPHRIYGLPLLPDPLEFRFDEEGDFHWLDERGPELMPYVGSLMQALGPWTDDESQSLTITLDTEQFYSTVAKKRQKLGLGSSAGLTVALAAAWYAYRHNGDRLDIERWLPTLVKLHRDLQGGRGSGADVASALYGGHIRYTVAPTQQTPGVSMVSTPQDIEWMWIWLGKSASTGVFLREMDAFKAQRGEEYRAHMKMMTDIAEQGIAAAQTHHASGLLDAIGDYGRAMERLGEASGVPVYTDDHRRLALWAKKYDVAFKPSGAGGGDIALAASNDTDALSDMAREIRASGYRAVSLGPSMHGLEIESK